MDLKSLIPLGREHSPTRFVDPLIRLQREIDRLFDDLHRDGQLLAERRS